MNGAGYSRVWRLTMEKQTSDGIVRQCVNDAVVGADHRLISDQRIEDRFVDALDRCLEERIERWIGYESGTC